MLVSTAEKSLSETLQQLAAEGVQSEGLVVELAQQLDSLAVALAKQERELRREKERLETEHTAERQARAALETEIQSLRSRLAEHSEALARQERAMAQERHGWGEELRLVRTALQAMQAASPPLPEPKAPAAPPRETPRVAAPRPEDPSRQSVLSQFETLQRDLARRKQPTGR